MSMRALDASCRVTAGEFRLTGRPASLAAAVAAVAAMRRLAGTAPLFVAARWRIWNSWASTDVYAQLSEAGLDGIAELPIDLLADPGPVRAARNAGLLVLRLTVDSAPADLLQLFAQQRRSATRSADSRRSRRCPGGCRSRRRRRVRRRQGGDSAGKDGAGHTVHSGGLALVRTEAGAGGAHRRRRRYRRGRGVGAGHARDRDAPRSKRSAATSARRAWNRSSAMDGSSAWPLNRHADETSPARRG